ncbi:MAG: ATP-binding protein [Prevotella sp.]|nr:ATP-binding protein [Prevotella sp.]
MNSAIQEFSNTVKKPVELLSQYYTQVLDRPVNLRQTWLLLNAQTAFLFAAFPVEGPLLFRIACCGWLLHAVLLCRKAL